MCVTHVSLISEYKLLRRGGMGELFTALFSSSHCCYFMTATLRGDELDKKRDSSTHEHTHIHNTTPSHFAAAETWMEINPLNLINQLVTLTKQHGTSSFDGEDGVSPFLLTERQQDSRWRQLIRNMWIKTPSSSLCLAFVYLEGDSAAAAGDM